MEDMVLIPQMQFEVLLIAWDEFLEGVASCAGIMPTSVELDELEGSEEGEEVTQHATV